MIPYILSFLQSVTGRVRNVFGGAELLEGHYSAGTKTRRSFHGLLSLPLTPSLRTSSQLSLFSLERDLSSFASSSESSHGLKAAINVSLNAFFLQNSEDSESLLMKSDWGAQGVHELAYQVVSRHIHSVVPGASVRSA